MHSGSHSVAAHSTNALAAGSSPHPATQVRGSQPVAKQSMAQRQIAESKHALYSGQQWALLHTKQVLSSGSTVHTGAAPEDPPSLDDEVDAPQSVVPPRPSAPLEPLLPGPVSVPLRMGEPSESVSTGGVVELLGAPNVAAPPPPPSSPFAHPAANAASAHAPQTRIQVHNTPLETGKLVYCPLGAVSIPEKEIVLP